MISRGPLLFSRIRFAEGRVGVRRVARRGGRNGPPSACSWAPFEMARGARPFREKPRAVLGGWLHRVGPSRRGPSGLLGKGPAASAGRVAPDGRVKGPLRPDRGRQPPKPRVDSVFAARAIQTRARPSGTAPRLGCALKRRRTRKRSRRFSFRAADLLRPRRRPALRADPPSLRFSAGSRSKGPLGSSGNQRRLVRGAALRPTAAAAGAASRLRRET